MAAQIKMIYLNSHVTVLQTELFSGHKHQKIRKGLLVLMNKREATNVFQRSLQKVSSASSAIRMMCQGMCAWALCRAYVHEICFGLTYAGIEEFVCHV
jgi:hypothetical protein